MVQDLRDPQTLNPYSYCRNNPLKYTDPSGHLFWVPLLVGFFVGALVGAAGYTASVVIDNAIHHQPLLDNWDPVDCATWAAVGGVSGAILSGGALVTAMGSRFAASMLVNTVGSEVGYGISAGRKGEWTPEGALLTGGIAAGFTAVGMGLGALAGKLRGGAVGSGRLPVEYDPYFALRQGGNSRTVVPDSYVVVRGGQSPMPRPGTVFSGSTGRTLAEAAAGVPHGSIRVTSAGQIRSAGGFVELAPEAMRSGLMNIRHVNILEGGPTVFGDPVQHPIPKYGRLR